jgi:transcriptional regulator with XRE-family HTH domain
MLSGSAMSAGRPAFPTLLRQLRRQAGLSQNALARASAIDPAYVNRMEAAADLAPLVPRPAVLVRLCAALGVSPLERDRLYFAAGRCPPSLAGLGAWDPAVGRVAALLADPALEPDDRAEFRLVLDALIERWRRAARGGAGG